MSEYQKRIAKMSEKLDDFDQRYNALLERQNNRNFQNCVTCGAEILVCDTICEECINIEYSDNLFDDFKLQNIA